MILKINDRIRNRKIEFFNEVRIELKYDACASSFAFKLFFDPENIEHKEMLCVGHYHICTIEEYGEKILTGYILTQKFESDENPNLASISGYSLPGFLEDCDIPPDVSLQADGLTLKQIAERYIQPFGLKIRIDAAAAAGMNEPYEESTAKETQGVRSYLSDLAAQKNIIMSHDADGAVLFTKALPNQKPIADFKKDLPVTKMGFIFNGQAMHSDIIVIRQDDIDDEVQTSEGASVKNPYVPIVYRPKTIVQSSTNEKDIEQAVRNARAQELKNMPMTIHLDRWQIDGKIVRPGKEITVLNPEVYMYKKTRWFIESVELHKDPRSETAILKCVPPEVYTGEDPKYMFAGINLH